MSIRSFFLSLSVILIFSSSVFAREGKTVNHSHDGRSHAHPLPTEGLGHNHKYKGSDEWDLLIVIDLKNGRTAKHYAKKGSRVTANGKSMATGKVVVTGKATSFKKWSLSSSDCHKEKGKISTFIMEGNPIQIKPQSTMGFWFSQKRIATTQVANYICNKKTH